MFKCKIFDQISTNFIRTLILLASIFNYYYFYCNNRHANAPFVKKWCIKSSLWHSIESSVEFLRIKKCDNMTCFHRKKVCTHPICKSRSTIIKFRIFSIRKTGTNFFFHKFFAWTRLSKPLASHKTVYSYKDLDIWFFTNRTFDPSWRFFTFGRLRGIRKPLNCSQIMFTSLEHLEKI